MAQWVEVAPVSAFPPGTWRDLEWDGQFVAVFNLEGRYYALENVCTHDGGELTGGTVAEGVVTCPRHGARFAIATGEVLGPPAYEAVRVIPVRVAEGMVQVECQ